MLDFFLSPFSLPQTRKMQYSRWTLLPRPVFLMTVTMCGVAADLIRKDLIVAL